MPLRIILRKQVPEDLHQIVEYLETHSLAAADRFIESLFVAFDELARTPGIGSPKRFRSRQLEGIRSWWVPGFRKYLIFYRFTEEAVTVLAVQHGARNIRALLRKRIQK